MCSNRPRVPRLALICLVIIAWPPGTARAQWAFDARQLAMGDVLLDRSALMRFNAAYRALPPRQAEPRFAIPIPLGLLDLPTFDSEDPEFNVFELVNLALYPPLFLELRKPTIPDRNSDIELFVARDSLKLDLGDARSFVPEDDFTFGGYSRPVDVGVQIKGLRVAVSSFLHNETGVALDDNMRGFLREVEPALPDTRYGVTADAIGQVGFAPAVTYSFHVPGTGRAAAGPAPGEARTGLYLGSTLRYYLGLSFGEGRSTTGLTTGDPIFDETDPTNVDFSALLVHQTAGDGLGTGIGVDLGAVYFAGPWEVGLGVTDIGSTTLTWKGATRDTFFLDDDDRLTDSTLATDVEHKTLLPATLVANVGIDVGGLFVAASAITGVAGTELRVGGEKWFGPVALRGGTGIDRRNKLQFGLGGGVRLGPVGLDVALMTHSASISGERGIRLASSIAIY